MTDIKLITEPEDIHVPSGYSLNKPVPTLCVEANSNIPYRMASPDGLPVESSSLYRAIFIDFEATGINPKEDTPIEIGLIEAYIDVSTGLVYQISKTYSALNDPGIPIPAEVTAVTGISDSDVAGHEFNLAEIEAFITNHGKHAPIMIAHNAQYDQTLFERLFPHINNLPWACTLHDINWGEDKPMSLKLELILLEQGYRYSAHRAFEDCLALLWMCHKNHDVFAPILPMANEPTYIIYAVQFPFDDKDKLKTPDMNFEWDGERRVWKKSVKGISVFNEYRERLSELYMECGSSPALIADETARTPLSSRVYTRK